MSNIIKKTFKIEGMHCNSCAMNIDLDLEDMQGVKTVKTSLENKVSEVEYDPASISEQEIIEQISKTGYTAQVIV